MKRWLLIYILLLTTLSLSAQQRMTITGHLLGYDSSAMQQAHVQLLRPNQLTALTTTEVGRDGGFRLATSQTGFMLLRFSGVGHQTLNVPVLVEGEGEAELDVRLQAQTYPDVIDSIRTIGDFNSFAYGTAQAMERQPDSTFVITFETTSSEIAYQILGVGDDAIVGTDADDYVFDGNGNYRSVVRNSDDRVRIVFDPRLLVRSTNEPGITWTDTTRQKLAEIYEDIQRRHSMYEQALMAHRAAGGSIAEFSYNWSSVLKKLIRRLDSEPDSLLRQALFIGYLDLATCDATKDLDPAVIRRALDDIPPSSPLWAINPKLVPIAVKRADNEEKYGTYTQLVIEQNSDPVVRAPLLYDGLVVAHRNNDPERARNYYQQLVNEFANTPYAGMARVEFAMN